MPVEDQVFVALGFLLGAVAETLYDYLFRLREDPDLAFDSRYWVRLLASVGISLIIGLTALAGFIREVPEGSLIYVFLVSFALGFSLSHVLNRSTS